MTVLTLGGAACDCAAQFIESKLPVHEPEAAQRICDALRECAENYGRTRVHIELEPDESTFIEADAAGAERRSLNRAELRLVTPDQGGDVALVLELAERFLAEGDLADATEAKRAPYVAAIARLKGN